MTTPPTTRELAAAVDGIASALHDGSYANVQSSLDAIAERLVSPNVADSNLEPANLVDTTNRIASAGFSIAKAIDRLAAAAEALAPKGDR